MTSQRKMKLLNVLNKRQPGLAVVLENVHDPHNIFAVSRTCDAVGIQDIYVIQTKIPKRKKFGMHSSSGAAKWLTLHYYEEVETCMKHVLDKYEVVAATFLGHQSKSLYELNFLKSTALVFGNETDGLSPEIRHYATENFMIPQVGIIESLNISVACAVSIYEAYRQRSLAGCYDMSSLSVDDYTVLKKKWGFTRLDD
jgi:tRNA (guanosine-2'-O-)-methyltransferase